MSEIKRIFPADTPTPRGPYSPAVAAGDFIYVSGQGPVDPVTDKMSYGDIRHETRITLNSIKRILIAGGATLNDVIRCGVFLRDGNDFAAMNEVYSEFFSDQRPARTTVAVAFADPTMKVEIDCVAYKPR